LEDTVTQGMLRVGEVSVALSQIDELIAAFDREYPEEEPAVSEKLSSASSEKRIYTESSLKL
jgi:hypothetical protein